MGRDLELGSAADARVPDLAFVAPAVLDLGMIETTDSLASMPTRAPRGGSLFLLLLRR
jgi:hypothetical protein